MPAGPEALPLVAGRPIFQNRNFVRLYSAATISLAGNQVGGIAVIFLVYTTSHSALQIAYLALISTLAVVGASVLGGTLADRYDRRNLMIVSDGIRAVSWVGLALVVALFGFQFLPILVVTGISSALTMTFNPASQALLPRIVGKGQVAAANGALSSTLSIVGFLAYAIGGAAVGLLGALPSIAVNGLTFVGSLVLVLAIRPTELAPEPERASAARPGFWADTREGFAYLRGQAGLLGITISAAFGNFFLFLPFLLVVVYAVTVLHGGSVVFGALLAANAAGTAIGAPLVHRYRRAILPNAGKVWIVHSILFGPAILALVLAPDVYVAGAGMFALGFLIGVGGTTWLSAAQLVVPSEMQGRYFGIDSLGSFAATPLASLLGGLLTQAYGVEFALWFAGLGILAVGLAILPVRAIWTWGAPTPGVA